VVVKVHVASLRAGGAKAAALHVRYIERDGVEKDGSKGKLYNADGPASAHVFQAPRFHERHQFRLIVSPEDADELNLTDYVRQFMARVERDLGRKLEWGAVNHYDTEHPHAHILIRGMDLDGREVRMERAYVARGLRHRAQELATFELGPRPEYDVMRQRRREMTQDRFTSLDREIERRSVDGRMVVRVGAQSARAQQYDSLLVGRLRHLEVYGLTERLSSTSWALMPRWQERLRELGERGDIIKEMHRALRADPARYRIVKPGLALGPDPAVPSPVVEGRVVKKGLADELRGSFFAVVETPSGGGLRVPLDARTAEAVREGDIVGLQTRPQKARREVDAELEAMARRNDGVYDPKLIEKAPAEPRTDLQTILLVDGQRERGYRRDGSGRGMPLAEVAKAHEMRLVELEKFGLVNRLNAGKWAVPTGLVEKLDARDKAEPRHRLFVQKQALGLADQVKHPGPVWLDRVNLEGFAYYGFGAEVREAVRKRQEVLRTFGIDPSDPARNRALRELERNVLARRIAATGGAQLLERMPPVFQGQIRLHQGADGHGYAEISDGTRFFLLPMTRDLQAMAGRTATVSRDPDGRMKVRELGRDRGGR
jgi:type IV secretory pathway VirD2 relaxase